jgi:integrase
MAKVKLTAGRIADFQCPPDKPQAFLWCAEVQGLGIRATRGSNRKRFIFESKIHTKSFRMTIGEVGVWSINDAQAEARTFQTHLDQGKDPRAVKEREAVEYFIEAENRKLNQSTKFYDVWMEYLSARKPHWSGRHYKDHIDLIHEGNLERSRSQKLTIAGPLASFRDIKLAELTPELINKWAAKEAAKRPARARLSFRLLKAFIFWCNQEAPYNLILSENIARNKKVKDILGKPQPRNDALQREQLKAWFAAVQNIPNPTISAYLQTLLLIGCRPNEITALLWSDIDFQWKCLTIRDKVDGERTIPLTPYVSRLLNELPRDSKYVFSSQSSKSGHLTSPHKAHDRACSEANIVLTIHGYRRSFASLCEWIEMPAGISAQIQGHKPQGVREKNYIRRALDLLRVWHEKIEAWILEEAGIYITAQKKEGH